MSRRAKRWAVILLLLLAVLCGLGLKYSRDHDPVRVVARLNGVLNIARQNAVTNYRDDDWCKYVATTTTFYGTPTASPTDACFSNSTQGVAFDERGHRLFAVIESALSGSGLGNLVLDIDYTPDGVVEDADLDLDQFIGHDSYLFRAGDEIPKFPKGRVTRLGPNWFYYRTD